MGTIPVKEPSDDLPTRNITANSYEPRELSAEVDETYTSTTKNTDPVEEDILETILSDSANDTMGSSIHDQETTPSTPTAGIVDFGFVWGAPSKEVALNLFAERLKTYQELELEAAENAIAARMNGTSLGELEHHVTEITWGINKTIAIEIRLLELKWGR